MSGNKCPNLKTIVLKKSVLLLILPIIVAITPGCKKDSCESKSPASEISQIQAYATANGITTTAHSSGLYYEIISMGTGPKANRGSKIAITYTGKLMSGQIFDEKLTANTDKPWELDGLIQGWIIGIPLINEGGHIKLIIPSSLAYGCEGKGMIPGDAVLFFDIQLVDVQ